MKFPWHRHPTAADRLRDLWVVEGQKAHNIAATLASEFHEPMSRNAVIGKAHRLGLSKKGHGMRDGRPKKVNGNGDSTAKQFQARKQSLARASYNPTFSVRPLMLAPTPVAQPKSRMPDRPESTGIPFLDRVHDRDCSWPLWGPDKKIGNVCGDRIPKGSRRQFCGFHFRCS